MTYIQDPEDHQFYRLSPEDARRPMSFKRAVKQCWEKYAIFDGRSRRSEYWWFGLFFIGSHIALSSLTAVDVCI